MRRTLGFEEQETGEWRAPQEIAIAGVDVGETFPLAVVVRRAGDHKTPTETQTDSAVLRPNGYMQPGKHSRRRLGQAKARYRFDLEKVAQHPRDRIDAPRVRRIIRLLWLASPEKKVLRLRLRGARHSFEQRLADDLDDLCGFSAEATHEGTATEKGGGGSEGDDAAPTIRRGRRQHRREKAGVQSTSQRPLLFVIGGAKGGSGQTRPYTYHGRHLLEVWRRRCQARGYPVLFYEVDEDFTSKTCPRESCHATGASGK